MNVREYRTQDIIKYYPWRNKIFSPIKRMRLNQYNWEKLRVRQVE